MNGSAISEINAGKGRRVQQKKERKKEKEILQKIAHIVGIRCPVDRQDSKRVKEVS